MLSFKFPKSERLTNKKKFEKLFEEGISVKGFPLKIIYISEDVVEGEHPIQIAFTVPKRSFKKAVDRNFLRRKMKEIYRLNKGPILEKLANSEKSLYAILIYTNREKMDYPSIEKGWHKLMAKLLPEIN
jgi:ribonuclease P protein component